MSLLGPKQKSFYLKTSSLYNKLFVALTSFVLLRASDQVKDMIRKMKHAVNQFVENNDKISPNTILIFEERGNYITIDFSFMVKERIPRYKAKDLFSPLIDNLEAIKSEYLE